VSLVTHNRPRVIGVGYPSCVSRAIAAHIRWLRKQLAEFDATLEDAIPARRRGARRQNCCGACRRWVVSPSLLCSPICRSLARWAAARLSPLVGVAPFNRALRSNVASFTTDRWRTFGKALLRLMRRTPAESSQ
jgi:hypothetical protein